MRRPPRTKRALRSGGMQRSSAVLSRSFAKVCDLPDFRDPDIAALIPEIAPAHRPDRPHRKSWEYAMAALFLRDLGYLDGRARVLDVGAGTAEILFWLAQRVGQVVAVDIYGAGPFRE